TIRVEKGIITDGKRKGRFGEFAEAAAKLTAPQDVPLKDPAKFTLIGKNGGVGRVDSTAKSTGVAKFSIDQTAPGMLSVVVARAPRFGAKVKNFDATKALAIKGVVAVKQISTGVAVFATST